ncbi:hypothetical protein PVAP13_5KG545000 [Panicum virgatum]|uniref:Uncharacterized protein n=1 Tax=Panicum virgatum TaxID=38727 RepID=A0A8T0SQB3_PANVG|nr:hypothetical protein PVAP13_5KG545000 [Panicum virgatum]
MRWSSSDPGRGDGSGAAVGQAVRAVDRQGWEESPREYLRCLVTSRGHPAGGWSATDAWPSCQCLPAVGDADRSNYSADHLTPVHSSSARPWLSRPTRTEGQSPISDPFRLLRIKKCSETRPSRNLAAHMISTPRNAPFTSRRAHCSLRVFYCHCSLSTCLAPIQPQRYSYTIL